MGVGDQVPARARAARRAGDAARRARAGQRRPRAVRRDHDRHARLRRARGPEDLQPAPARLREGRRQPDRALQHPGARPGAVRAVPGRAAAQRRRGVGGGLAGRDPGARRTRRSHWPNAITKADFDGWVEQRGSKFFTHLGQGLHADDRHLRQGPGAAAGRLAARRRTARARTPTSPTRCTASCPTACRAPIASRRTCWRWASVRPRAGPVVTSTGRALEEPPCRCVASRASCASHGRRRSEPSLAACTRGCAGETELAFCDAVDRNDAAAAKAIFDAGQINMMARDGSGRCQPGFELLRRGEAAAPVSSVHRDGRRVRQARGRRQRLLERR